MRVNADLLPKSTADAGPHRVIYLGPWAFPLSSFQENEWYLLSHSHVPINYKHAAWECEHPTTIHVSDWTNNQFIRENSGYDSQEAPPPQTVSLLKEYIRWWVLKDDPNFGAIGFSETLQSDVVWFCKMTRRTLLVVPFELRNGVYFFDARRISAIDPMEPTWVLEGDKKKLLLPNTRERAKQVIRTDCCNHLALNVSFTNLISFRKKKVFLSVDFGLASLSFFCSKSNILNQKFLKISLTPTLTS